jgi:branched-subunit amino acid transport protein AzlD
MATSFGSIMETLTGLGFFEGLLPFVVTYAIFFFILRYIADQVLFDEWDNNKPDQFAAIISIAFAFFTARFIMSNPAYADFFTQYVGRTTILVVGLLGLLVILGFVGIDLNSNKGLVGGVLALLIVAAFTVSGGLPASILPGGEMSNIAQAFSFVIDSGLIYILLIGGLLYYTIRDPDKETESTFVPFGYTPGDDDGD